MHFGRRWAGSRVRTSNLAGRLDYGCFREKLPAASDIEPASQQETRSPWGHNPQPLEFTEIFANQIGRITSSGVTHGPPPARVDATNGVYRYDQLIVLRMTHMPAVLLQAGAIINHREELELAKPVRVALVADAATTPWKPIATRAAITSPKRRRTRHRRRGRPRVYSSEIDLHFGRIQDHQRHPDVKPSTATKNEAFRLFNVTKFALTGEK